MKRGENMVKYRPDFPDLVRKWCQEHVGLTDHQLAKALGVSTASFYNYRNQYPEFDEAVIEGRRRTDALVEHALYKLCVGVVQEEVEEWTDAEGNVYKRKQGKTKVPPDIRAIRYWLNNRSEHWNDRTEIQHTGETVFEVKLIDAPSERKVVNDYIESEQTETN
jgi:hypothetical protein